MAISLRELSKLASVLEIRTRLIFSDKNVGEQSISLEQLRSKIRDYLTTTGMNIAEFEEKVGFEIQAGLQDAAKIMEWNVDCLRFVCAEIGVDWLAALPE